MGKKYWWWVRHGPLPPHPPPGSWTRQALHWPSRRGPALQMRSPQTLFFGNVFFCPLCPSRYHPYVFQTGGLCVFGKFCSLLIFVSFPFWGMKLFHSKALFAELPRMTSYGPQTPGIFPLVFMYMQINLCIHIYNINTHLILCS